MIVMADDLTPRGESLDQPAPIGRRRQPVSLLIAVAVVLITALAVSLYFALVRSDDPAIRVDDPYGNAAGVSMPGIPSGTEYHTVVYSLCTTTGGPVSIDRVEPIDASGPVTVDWAVHRGRFGPTSGIEDGNGPAARLPGFTHQPVTGKCNADPTRDSASSFAVGISGHGAVGVQAFRVVFKGGSVVVPFSMEVCPGPADSECPKLPGIDH